MGSEVESLVTGPHPAWSRVRGTPVTVKVSLHGLVVHFRQRIGEVVEGGSGGSCRSEGPWCTRSHWVVQIHSDSKVSGPWSTRSQWVVLQKGWGFKSRSDEWSTGSSQVDDGPWMCAVKVIARGVNGPTTMLQ